MGASRSMTIAVFSMVYIVLTFFFFFFWCMRISQNVDFFCGVFFRDPLLFLFVKRSVEIIDNAWEY